MKRVLFLYTRLADYFYQCIVELTRQHDINAYIVRYTPDVNAPLTFETSEKVQVVDYESFSEQELLAFCKKINPDLIYIAGWSNKTYLNLLKEFPDILRVLGLDNVWNGGVRQKVGVHYFSYFLKPLFSHIWVAGYPQYYFAKRLGFQDTQIIKGLYVADTAKYYKAYQHTALEEKLYPKSILFVGRLVAYKKPDLLAQAFHELTHQYPDWKLIFIGKGELETKIKALNNPRISFRGFIPPAELPDEIARCGVFCLPSVAEHWGVVVHEAVAAGLPIIVSDSVGAATEFLIDGYNGYVFKTNSKESLKNALQILMSKSDSELTQLGRNSVTLSKRLNQDFWIANLLSVLN